MPLRLMSIHFSGFLFEIPSILLQYSVTGDVANGKTRLIKGHDAPNVGFG